jgi:major intracellular serine protease
MMQIFFEALRKIARMQSGYFRELLHALQYRRSTGNESSRPVNAGVLLGLVADSEVFNFGCGDVGGMEMKLVQYEVVETQETASEIPEGVKGIGAPELWAQGITGAGVTVAVLDTGVAGHPDLSGRILGGRSFVGNDPADYTDGHGHGTHIAGIIASIENGLGVVGVAPGVKVLVGKVLGDKGPGRIGWVVEGIRWAADWTGPENERVSIISMSLASQKDYPELHEAVRYAVGKGILVVCSAGNEGDADADTDEYAYPAVYPEVMTVGAINTLRMDFPFFTNSNGEVDLVAPGVGIMSTYLNNSYAKLSGTSMAAPHVAGAAALIIQQFCKEHGRRPLQAELYNELIRRTVTVKGERRIEGNGLLQLLADRGKADPAGVA